MSGFAADWLTLREPADRRARDPALLDAVAAHLAGRGPVRVTDLACGTGSTFRALSPRLPARQSWRLVDHDPALLEAAARCGGGEVRVETLRANLSTSLEDVIAMPADLVTTSAFLDLVPDDWLGRLAAAAAASSRPLYAALSYDGRVGCEPADPLDAEVLAAFDAHQRRDKGLGGALGPAAAGVAARRLVDAGFEVACARADWRLGPEDAALQRRLVLGWHGAVAETGLVDAGALDAWLARRLAAIDEGRSRLSVGHVDLWATPRADGRSAARSTSQSTSPPSG
ncbi:MAG TPA: class I SAM-dependent methyltransferase [Burkholderiaceae bacterium]|nr:class I SAM-dependent methyltransferase [Burkholderiaceae bacterium]